MKKSEHILCTFDYSPFLDYILQGDLICFQRTGDEIVPGCTGLTTDFTTEDFCIPKPTNLLQNIGDEYTNGYYGECQGDCDSNSDCFGDLVCFPRTGKQTDMSCAYMSVYHFQ